MKTKTQLVAAALLAVTALVSAAAQGFDTGSNGSLGALNVTDADVVVDLPPDGRLHYTTVTVAARRTLSFNRNALNTPVELLAQGDIVIEGVVTVNGQTAPDSPRIGGLGGPGGFDGGKPGFPGFAPGDGYGPGGGGAHPTDRNASSGGGHNGPGGGSSPGAAYGSPLLIPLMGGSGGGGSVGFSGNPGHGGHGGGGAILLASNTRILVANGAFIVANGGNWRGESRNDGSGGAIRLLAPRVEGTGRIQVHGGGGGGGAAGRIRVDCFDKTNLRLGFEPAFALTMGANMFVAPPTLPRLDVIRAAGTDIPLGTGNTVQVLLPFNSDTNQTVTLRAQDFNADVPVRLTLTPDSGPRIVIDTNIVNTAQNPATLVIPVGLPVNNLVTIHAWTR